MELSASKIPRIEVVDALRGFAVMAIILVHNLETFYLSSLSNRTTSMASRLKRRSV